MLGGNLLEVRVPHGSADQVGKNTVAEVRGGGTELSEFCAEDSDRLCGARGEPQDLALFERELGAADRIRGQRDRLRQVLDRGCHVHELFCGAELAEYVSELVTGRLGDGAA